MLLELSGIKIVRSVSSSRKNCCRVEVRCFISCDLALLLWDKVQRWYLLFSTEVGDKSDSKPQKLIVEVDLMGLPRNGDQRNGHFQIRE